MAKRKKRTSSSLHSYSEKMWGEKTPLEMVLSEESAMSKIRGKHTYEKIKISM